MKFPLRKGKIPKWIFGHVTFTLALFTGIYWFTMSIPIASIAGLFYPVRALVWKAPWAPGYDVNDPPADYIWGAIVPALVILAILGVHFTVF